ncbi:MAG: patatin-like phospholipase family protein, partial [Acidobacteriaceae bacterium]|nr:patatin-like phospholipase family protein [Acidobacteriaceae bacterium]
MYRHSIVAAATKKRQIRGTQTTLGDGHERDVMLSLTSCRFAVVAVICLVGLSISGKASFAQEQGAKVQVASPENAASISLSSRRPRIGLALEGGGALGFAHIGVLEWLEANHIPVDDLSGTSMGGLVGGL